MPRDEVEEDIELKLLPSHRPSLLGCLLLWNRGGDRGCLK